MKMKILLFVHFFLIIDAKVINKIDLEKCNLEEVKVNLTKDQFKKRFEKSSGFGLWNIWKGEYGHFMPKMSREALTQMCYCMFKRIYSFQGEKSSIEFENFYLYWRKIPYFSWQDYLVLREGTIKCFIPNDRYFFLIETEYFYKAPRTRDLFVLEVTEDELKNINITKKTGEITNIRYPAGKFKAYIPQVDLSEVV